MPRTSDTIRRLPSSRRWPPPALLLAAALATAACGGGADGAEPPSAESPAGSPAPRTAAQAPAAPGEEGGTRTPGGKPGEGSSTRPRRTQPVGPAGAELAARLSTACVQAAQGRTVRRPEGPNGLGEYARASIARTQRTLGELATVQVRGGSQKQLESLRSGYASLGPLYEQTAQAAAKRDRAALRRLALIIPTAERGVGELARSLGAPPCAPGG